MGLSKALRSIDVSPFLKYYIDQKNAEPERERMREEADRLRKETEREELARRVMAGGQEGFATAAPEVPEISSLPEKPPISKSAIEFAKSVPGSDKGFELERMREYQIKNPGALAAIGSSNLVQGIPSDRISPAARALANRGATEISPEEWGARQDAGARGGRPMGSDELTRLAMRTGTLTTPTMQAGIRNLYTQEIGTTPEDRAELERIRSQGASTTAEEKFNRESREWAKRNAVQFAQQKQLLEEKIRNAGEAKKDKPLMDAQSKDLHFANTVIESVRTIEDIMRRGGYDPNSMRGFFAPITPNMLKTEDQQLFDLAAKNAVIAALRKDTGAAYTTTEEKDYAQMNTPRFGDSPETINKKLSNLMERASSMSAGIPEGSKPVIPGRGVLSNGSPVGTIVSGYKKIKAGPDSDQSTWGPIK